jgi:hypothetical protein
VAAEGRGPLPPRPPACPSARGRGCKGGLRPIVSGGSGGGCVTDRRQDAGAAAPSGGPENARAASRTPVLGQRAAPTPRQRPRQGAGWRPLESRLGVSLSEAGERGIREVPSTAPQTMPQNQGAPCCACSWLGNGRELELDPHFCWKC